MVDNSQYKLVMVGREVDETELEGSEGQHLLTNAVFQESNEKFGEGVKMNEGVVKHYLRNAFMVVGLLVGAGVAARLYQASYAIMPLYEDYLEWVIF